MLNTDRILIKLDDQKSKCTQHWNTYEVSTRMLLLRSGQRYIQFENKMNHHLLTGSECCRRQNRNIRQIWCNVPNTIQDTFTILIWQNMGMPDGWQWHWQIDLGQPGIKSFVIVSYRSQNNTWHADHNYINAERLKKTFVVCGQYSTVPDKNTTALKCTTFKPTFIII